MGGGERRDLMEDGRREGAAELLEAGVVAAGAAVQLRTRSARR